ncbi:MAG: hydrogenase maturation nickel metallochaperone HypA [Campylobacterales bacterium]|nr:hydrogenase maturation nickel metallochaperone HypA [Campylobacterales bacterium]
MHEYSIVQALLEQCEHHAAANGASAVTKVVVKIGQYSGVEPHLLEVAFDTFKEHTVCSGAHFVMNLQPLVVECRSCGVRSTLERPHYLCPLCGSGDVRVDEGEEMYLMTLEMDG